LEERYLRERGDEEKLLVVSNTDELLVDVRERGDEEELLVVSYTDEPCGGCKRKRRRGKATRRI
jgi:hypothetical protein